MIISANIQRKNIFLNWGISIVVGLVLSAGLSATATSSYDISTIAGNGLTSFADGAIATATGLNNPNGVCVQSSGNVYFADSINNRIQMIVGAVGTYFGIARATADIGKIYTIAGTGTAGFAGDSAAAASAMLNNPNGVYVDSAGNVYIADTNNNRIRKITASNGIISTIAGNGTPGFSGDGAVATSAKLNTPNGIYVDSSGNVYIADTGNNHIRKLTANTGVISTIAGGSVTTAGFAGDSGSATAAAVRLSSPYGIYVDSSNNVYIADTNNDCIRMLINTAGTYFGIARATADIGKIYTIAGTGTAGFAGDNAAATSAMFSSPRGVYVKADGTVYIADTGNNRIRMIDGIKVSTVAGASGLYSGDSGLATAASMSNPGGVCKDSSGNIYFADTDNNCIRRFTDGGNISTLSEFTGLNGPKGICIDSANNLFVANTGGNSILKRTSAGVVSTLSAFTGLNSPQGVFVDSFNNIYVADTGNSFIRMLWGAPTTTGTNNYVNGSVYTIASSVAPTSPLNAGANMFGTPIGIWAVGRTTPNNIRVYFTDLYSVRFFNPSSSSNSLGTVYKVTTANSSTISVGIFGDANTATNFDTIYYTKGGNANNIYKAPFNYNAKTSSTTNIVGSNASAGFSGDGGLATSALLNSPYAVYFDGTTFYVSDSGNNRIRKFTQGGNISTIAGTTVTNAGFSGDGSAATSAKLNSPSGIYIDSSGNVYISDTGNNRIRKLLSKLVYISGTMNATAAIAYLQGGGTAVLPTTNSISAVEVNNGILQVSTPAPITFNASGGSAVVEITSNTSTGAYTFTTPGAVKIGTGIAVTLDAPSGSSLMSKTGAGRLRAVDNLSSSTTPVAVSEGILEVSGSGKLPNAATSVASGATLQLGTASGSVAAGAVANASVASGGIMSILAGATDAVTTATIASGGIVSVAAGVTAPSGMFTSATFRSGGILQVGDGATLGQSFTSVA